MTEGKDQVLTVYLSVCVETESDIHNEFDDRTTYEFGWILRGGLIYCSRKSCQRNVLSMKPRVLRTSICLAVFVCLLFFTQSVRALRGRQSKHTRSKSTAFCLSIESRLASAFKLREPLVPEN